MSLIEKASQGMSNVHPLVQSAFLKPGDPVTEDPTMFDIDYAFLARQGFFTPSDRPQSLALEMRAIKRRLLKRLAFYKLEREKLRAKRNTSEHRNVVLVTSTRPAEGKTFIAANLALSLAIEDQIETVLIDADAPRPKILSHFGLSGGKGLTDRLLDPSLDVNGLMLRARQAPLSILSEGLQYGDATELFAMEEMARLISELSNDKQDRLIIIDAPPVLATTEAVILARRVHEVMFIVEASATPESAVAMALEDVTDANPNVSLVLNKCLVQNSAKQYGAYYDNYYRGTEKTAETASGGALRSDRE